MQLFCPVCQSAFPGTQRCPQCGGLLLLPQEAAEAAAPRAAVAPPLPAEPTRAGRIATGAILTLGLYLALRKVITGAVLAAHPDPEAWWSSLDGLKAICVAQLLAVTLGAVVAAAGRTGGIVFGGAVGGLCGALFLVGELLAGAPARDLILYVQPLVLACVGGVAGVLATRVWGAVPALNIPSLQSKPGSSGLLLEETKEEPRPTSWLRIILGVLLVLAIVAATDDMRIRAQRYSGGLLKVSTVGEGHFLTWQFAVLGVMLGGGVAAAGTGAGFRHGLIAGFIAGGGVVALTVATGEAFNPSLYFLDTLRRIGLEMSGPIVNVAIASWVVAFSTIGGWLGGILIPPLAPAHLRQRLSSVD